MRMGSVEHFEKLYKRVGLVTLGDDKKIAYQEEEILALMEEKRMLCDIIDRQEKIIERLGDNK